MGCTEGDEKEEEENVKKTKQVSDIEDYRFPVRVKNS